MKSTSFPSKFRFSQFSLSETLFFLICLCCCHVMLYDVCSSFSWKHNFSQITASILFLAICSIFISQSNNSVHDAMIAEITGPYIVFNIRPGLFPESRWTLWPFQGHQGNDCFYQGFWSTPMTYESDTDFNKLSFKTSYLSHTAPHAPCTFSSLSINSYI